MRALAVYERPMKRRAVANRRRLGARGFWFPVHSLTRDDTDFVQDFEFWTRSREKLMQARHRQKRAAYLRSSRHCARGRRSVIGWHV